MRLTGPVDAEIGQQYIRDISIGADTPEISFHSVMQNVTGYPQTWSEQTGHASTPPPIPLARRHFNTKFWGVTAAEPDTLRIPSGYHVRTGPQDNPAYSVSDGTFGCTGTTSWQGGLGRLTRRVAGGRGWCDRIHRWWSATTSIPTAEYPGKATIIFYSSGQPRRRAPPAGPQPAAQTQDSEPSSARDHLLWRRR